VKTHLLVCSIIGVIAFMPIPSSADHDLGAAASQPQIRTRFELTVHAPYKIAFPLFGPNGERAWAGKDWDPQFVYPSPATDVQGAVFTIQHGPHRAIWVNTAFDIEGRHIQYAYFISDVMVTTIDLTFPPSDSDRTKIEVVYERTGLNTAANADVKELGVIDRARGADWEKAINAFLEQQ
jgi:hypothetical protein